jgi:hypothetical protein
MFWVFSSIEFIGEYFEIKVTFFDAKQFSIRDANVNSKGPLQTI